MVNYIEAMFFLLVVALCLFGGCQMGASAVEDYYERETVKRGYAEWYSDEPGHSPNKWRWKE